jgi:hypothetical protein
VLKLLRFDRNYLIPLEQMAQLPMLDMQPLKRLLLALQPLER